MQLLSVQTISGTSRYVGMAGAMAAVGGDVSAAKDNPAALGLFLHSEATVSFDYLCSQTCSKNHNVALPDLSWVFSVYNLNKQRGVLANNFLLSYKRLAVFNSDWQFSERGMSASQTDVMALQAAGLSSASVQASDAYNDSEVGWLTKAGYDAWLIDPREEGGTDWRSLEDGLVDAKLRLREKGKIDAFTLGWGMNISHRWYVGLTMNLLSLDYQKSSVYSEEFESGNDYQLSSVCDVKGIGVNFTAGLLWRPSAHWRLAASVQTPSFSQLATTCYGDIVSHLLVDGVNGQYSSQSPSYKDELSRPMPMRVVAGLAYQLGEKGMISTEYDYQHGFETSVVDEHLMKFGAEAVLKRHVFLNMGYAVRLPGKYKEGEGVFVPGTNSARLDTDFRQPGLRHFASAGLSYRTQHIVLGAAYQFSLSNQLFFAHYLQEHPWDGKLNQHRVVVSLAFKY